MIDMSRLLWVFINEIFRNLEELQAAEYINTSKES